MNVSELLAESQKRCVARPLERLDVPQTFVLDGGFLKWIRVEPHPYQRVFCLVAYDGLQPCDLDGEDRSMAHAMFDSIEQDGTVNVVERFEPFQRHKVWSLMGGRAGKTYMLGALRLVWGAYVRDLSSLAPGQKAVTLCCAPNDGLRQEIINYQLGAIRSKPELRATLLGPKTAMNDDASPESFWIRRPWDNEIVTFAGATANRGGYSGRGRSLTDFLADEMAFFLGEGNVVNDKEVIKGAAPRVLPGGQTIGQTTAFAKLGYHWDEFKANYGHPKAAIAAKATTEQLRPDASDMVSRERLTDPENARREFDAEPMAEGASIFFSEALISSCVRDVPWFGTNAHAANHQVEKSGGGDMGFRSNSSALAITYRVLAGFVLGEVLEQRPGTDGVALRPSVTVSSFAATMRLHGVSYFMADGHYRESVVEHLGDVSFIDAPTPEMAAVRARTLMRDGRVTIPDPDSLPPEQANTVRRLIRQLKEVRGQPTAGGRMSIHYPRWPDGSHGDLAVAFVLSLYQMAGESEDEKPPERGTEEWALAEMHAMQAELRDSRTGRRR